MIDPLEAVIKYLSDDADLAVLVEGRVAGKHQFGAPKDPWPQDGMSLRLRLDGGTPELSVEVQVLRIEATCYGESPHEARRVWRRLVLISRATVRETVAVTEGNALIHSLNMASGPSQIVDPDVDVDATLVFLEAEVAEQEF